MRLMKLVVDNTTGIDWSRDSKIVCAFCNLSKFEVPTRTFIAGDDVYICSDCTKAAKSMVTGE